MKNIFLPSSKVIRRKSAEIQRSEVPNFYCKICSLPVAGPKSQVNKKHVTFCFVFDLITSFWWEISKTADSENTSQQYDLWWRIITSDLSQSTELGCQKNRKITLIKTAETLRFFIEFHSNFAEVCFFLQQSFWKSKNWFRFICSLKHFWRCFFPLISANFQLTQMFY